MSLLAFLGLRHPVTLIPLLLFETLWKVLWLSIVAVPTAAAGGMDPATTQVAVNCAVVVVVVAVIPWRYVWSQYATRPAEDWRQPARERSPRHLLAERPDIA